MAPCKDESVGWRDEGLVPVSLLLLSYVGVLFPMSVWTLIGVCLMLLGGLVTVAMWHGATSRNHDPSPATRCAVWMLKIWAPWTLLCRALVG
jgi:hypothetical protein